MAHVLTFFRASGAGVKMEECPDGVFVWRGRGLEGDRYALERGAYSNIEPKKIRHVTFIEEEAIAAANAELLAQGLQIFEPWETRRNILTSGIRLNSLVGKEFMVSTAAFRGVELADPCHRPSMLAKKKGFREAFTNRGGLRAEVLVSGSLYRNDPIELLPA